MNKLFIIGNGFDLAHGYPTAYADFVKWIWNNIHKDPTNEKFKNLITINTDFPFLRQYNENLKTNINCYSDFLYDFNSYKKHNIGIDSFDLSAKYRRIDIYNFKNKFFFELCLYFPDAKWSDIESLFYKILTDLLNGNRSTSRIDIDTLNKNLEEIKSLFSTYLFENVKYPKVNFKTPFTDLLKYKSKILEGITIPKDSTDYLNEFPVGLYSDLVEFNRILKESESKGFWPKYEASPETLILDFNYTNTIRNYLDSINFTTREYGRITHLQIHGELNNVKNPINLGFGDEMDDHYKTLEKKNDNRYLRYIKSFMYSNNTNYRKLLNWIDSHDFQVFILGHSCGLSDRIMLNTIFEHERCKSIKLYYYQYEEDGIENDDFTDKVQNISRHFNKKKQMRDKIVDKSLSQPLKV